MPNFETNSTIFEKSDSTQQLKRTTSGIEILSNRSYAALEEDLYSLLPNELSVSPEAIKNSFLVEVS